MIVYAFDGLFEWYVVVRFIIVIRWTLQPCEPAHAYIVAGKVNDIDQQLKQCVMLHYMHGDARKLCWCVIGENPREICLAFYLFKPNYF